MKSFDFEKGWGLDAAEREREREEIEGKPLSEQ